MVSLVTVMGIQSSATQNHPVWHTTAPRSAYRQRAACGRLLPCSAALHCCLAMDHMQLHLTLTGQLWLWPVCSRHPGCKKLQPWARNAATRTHERETVASASIRHSANDSTRPPSYDLPHSTRIRSNWRDRCRILRQFDRCCFIALQAADTTEPTLTAAECTALVLRPVTVLAVACLQT
jgi:hypothetical protein